MPVTYIDLPRAAGVGTRARAGLSQDRLVTSCAYRIGQASRSSKSGRPSKPAIAQVTVDAAVDDADHRRHLRRRRRRPVSARGRRRDRGEIVPQRSQAQPARRSRARHAEGAVERTVRVGHALKIRDAVAREERRRLRLGVHVDEDHRRPAVGHRRSPRRDVRHHLLAQRTAEVPQEDEQQRAARGERRQRVAVGGAHRVQGLIRDGWGHGDVAPRAGS